VWCSLPLSCVHEAKRCVQTEYKEEEKKSRELNPIMQFRKKERKKERQKKKLFRVLNKQFFRV